MMESSYCGDDCLFQVIKTNNHIENDMRRNETYQG